MRYCGLPLRDKLILKNIKINKNSSVLEIGCGLGSIIDKFIKKIKEYHGLDISPKTIDYLSSLYKNVNNIKFHITDVCKENVFLNKKFDVIISADTLEHVKSPKNYFNFIRRHLKSDGTALIIFPNESEKKHHGITWFNNKKELIKLINQSSLKIIELKEIQETLSHKIIKKFLWNIPKSLIYKSKNKPQVFEDTKAFQIVQKNNIKTKFFSIYAQIITKMVQLLPLYKHKNIEENIINKRLLIKLKINE